MSVEVRIGDVVADKYRVTGVLGVGGMGMVVAARHVVLDEQVALKLLLPDAAANPELIARFLREGRAAAKLKSEHVVRIRDVGTLPSGLPYMVMEHLEGRDLESLIEATGPLPVAQAIDVLLQACEALAEAHDAGIVHRDLKPSNLFVVTMRDGSRFVKVLDFGISKLASTDDGKLTTTNTALGSPLYMAPEQMLDSKSVDARADVWACGVVLYEMLAGQPPFSGTSIPEISIRIATTAHTPLRRVRPDVPAPLEAIVDRALAKRPELRFASIPELAVALAPFAAPESSPSLRRIVGSSSARLPVGASTQPVVLPSAMDATVAVATDPRTGPRPATGRRLAIGVGVGVGVALALAGVGLVATRGTRDPAAAAAPSSNEPAPLTTSSGVVVVDGPPARPPTTAEPSPSASLAAAPPKTTTKRAAVGSARPAVTGAAPTAPEPAPTAPPAPSQVFDSRK